MTRQVVSYHDNFELKSTREYKNGKLVIREEFDDQGFLLYKEDLTTLYLFERLPNGNSSVYLEDKVKNSWERHLYDINDNKLLSERSNGTWHETRYDDNGRKIFFLNCYGSIHHHDSRGNIKYEDTNEPELLCNYELNFKKNENKYGGLEN